jgi:hypothetical protein
MNTLRLVSVLVLLAIPVGAGASPIASGSAGVLLQALIDLPGLQPYWHPEVPGRIPLILLEGRFGRGHQLVKFGQPVRILPRSEVKDRPFLEITTFLVTEDGVRIGFRYRVEGVVGSVFFVRKDRTWAAKETRIAEQ